MRAKLRGTLSLDLVTGEPWTIIEARLPKRIIKKMLQYDAHGRPHTIKFERIETWQKD